MTFEEIIEQARREGVIREENLPFLLEPSRMHGAGVLLVHGFSASPWEMRPLAEMLLEQGFVCYGLRLPGHGTSPQDLAGRSYQEWVRSVSDGLAMLSRRCERVYAAGQSTGGLALLAAAETFPVDGMVLLAPFLKLRHPLARVTGLLRYLRRHHAGEVPPDRLAYYYQQRPVSGIHELRRLARRAGRGLALQRAPALLLAAEGDQTVDPGSAMELFRRLGSPRREFHLFGPEVPHVLTLSDNPRQDQVFSLVRMFFRSLEPTP